MATLTYTIPQTKCDKGCYVKRNDGAIVFLRIEQDLDPVNPRIEYDGNLSHIICWHRNYQIGDNHSYNSIYSLEEYLKAERAAGNDYFMKPVYMLDHSNITLSTMPFSNHYDSGLIGFAFVFKNDMVDAGIIQKNDDVWRKKASAVIDSEIDEYNQYLEGDVYGYTELEYFRGNWKETDSCWGFFGDDPRKNGMLDSIGGGSILNIKNERELMKRWKEL